MQIRNSFRRSLLYALLALCGISEPAAAQALKASAGASTLMGASGFQVDYKWTPVSGWFGAGYNQGFTLGGFLGTTVRDTQVGFGDVLYSFPLATDVFGGSYYFFGRGLSLSRTTEHKKLEIFAGFTAQDLSTSFLRARKMEGKAGAVFFEQKISSRLTLQSSNVFTREISSLQSVSFEVTPKWKMSATGGVGANSPYFSVATQFDNRLLGFSGSYTISGDKFQRLRAPGSLFSERIGANVKVRLSPLKNLRLDFGHENVNSPFLGSGAQRASLNSVNFLTSVAGFGVSGGLSQSRAGQFSTQTALLSISRRFGSRFGGYGAILRQSMQGNQQATVYQATFEEKLHPRLSLRETITHTGGNTTFSWGGRFLSNRFTLGLDYQTIFTTLAGGFNGRPSVQAWTMSLQLRLPGGVRVMADTYVDPAGKIRYTAAMNDLMYRGEEQFVGSMTSPEMHRYVVKGIVQDEAGNRLWGISVRVGDHQLYSDTLGQFSVRVKKRATYEVRVSTELCLTPGPWEVVSTPPSIVADTDASFQPITIVLKRSGGTPRTFVTTGDISQIHKGIAEWLQMIPVTGPIPD